MEPVQVFDKAEQSWFDRNGFPPWLVALLWVVIAFLLFQTLGSIYMVIMTYLEFGRITEEHLLENAFTVLTGNTIGQFLGLALATMLVALLSVSKQNYAVFMRFMRPEGGMKIMLLSVLLIIVVQPVLWFLSWVNQMIPMPESLMQFEEEQINMLTTLLGSGLPLWFMIVTFAVTPAICEEIMFRGYLLRLFEKSSGVIYAIIITGVIFGLFHLRLSHLIPLSVIGILLAWVTIRTGSVLPAMIMHLLHNGGTVTAVHYYPEMVEMDSADALPAYWIIILGFVLTIYLIYLYKRWSTPKTEDGYV